MRILIVEDERVSRTKMETIMETFGDCETAENGRQALHHFQQAAAAGTPFQLVTLDIEMPDLSGTEVLQRMRRFESENNFDAARRAKIVMVTSQSDQQQVIACLQGGCDDYIAKPFDIGIIREKLARLELWPEAGGDAEPAAAQGPSASDQIMTDINSALRSGKLSLPVQPRIGLKFMELQSAAADPDQILRLVKQDMAVVVRLMAKAHAGQFQHYGTVENFERAVERLGPARVRELITVMVKKDHFGALHRTYQDILHRLWRHSLATAFAADILYQFIPGKSAMDPYTAGLLHDIGSLALILIIAEMENRGGFGGTITPASLRETVGGMHVMFGEKLLEKWGFASGYVDALHHHHQPAEAVCLSAGARVVRLANMVADSAGYTTFPPDPSLPAAKAISTPGLNLKPEQLRLVQQQVGERMQLSAMGSKTPASLS